MSRKKVSDEEKILRGTFRADRAREKTITIRPGILTEMPKAPGFLGDEAAKIWKDLGGLLVEKKILDAADLLLFSALCTNAGLIIEAARSIKAEGFRKYLSDRNSQTSCALSALHKASASLVGLSNRFGLSPVDRARLIADKEDDEEAKEWEKLLSGGK